MMKLPFFLLITSFAAAQVHLDSAAREIVHNELKFSHTSVVKGRNAAFLEFLSDQCITFNPLPTNAKEIYKKLPERNAYLTWKPACVEIAASGDFGYSTGPWEIRRESLGNDPVSYGHYFSIWEKGSDGWKVIFDTGIGYERNQFRNEERQLVLPVRTGNNAAGKLSMNEMENSFAKISAVQSTAKAYAAFAARNIRVYRDKTFPSQGKQALNKETKRLTFTPFETKISSSNDLAYTCGIAVSPEKDTSTYVRVWRLENGWKIAIDFLSSIKQ